MDHVVALHNQTLDQGRILDVADYDVSTGGLDAEQVHGAPLAAAHIGELHYWRGDFDEALHWYQRALAALGDTDDPELVGEAAYRAGEILGTKGDTGPARALLRRAADSADATFAPQAAALLATLTDEHPSS